MPASDSAIAAALNAAVIRARRCLPDCFCAAARCDLWERQTLVAVQMGWWWSMGILTVTCFECPDARAVVHLKSIPSNGQGDKRFISGATRHALYFKVGDGTS